MAPARHRTSLSTPPRWPGVAIGYGLPTALAMAATGAWFSPGRFFATGDVPPYLRDNAAAELVYPWNHRLTGAGSASYAIVDLPDVALLAAARALGAPATLAQHVLVALCAGAAAFGAAYLAGAWVRRPAARAVAGLFGAFNAYLLVSYPNVLPAAAIGLTGLLAGMVLRTARGRPVRPLVLAAATVPACYLAHNPALLLVAAGCVVGCAPLAAAVAGRRPAARSAVLIARAAPWAILFNAWWIAPYAWTLVARDGATFAAQTDVATWAWSQLRSGLANVATLNAHWGWEHSEYFPYAERMDAGPGAVLRWLPVALAATGVLCCGRRHRRAAWCLAAVTAGLAVLATGTHPPLGAVNGWLYRHVPGAWLLRNPASKLGVPMVLAYAALIALAVARLGPITARYLGLPRRAAAGTAVLAAVAAVAYPWPLWTGAVAPTDRLTLPGTRVAVPAAWQRLADRLNGEPATGKVVILPLDPYYQVGTSWGYYGADTVPAQLISRPVLQQLPGGYFSAAPGVGQLLRGVQDALLDGDPAGAAGQLRALGVSHVLVRHDLRAVSQEPAPADADRLEATVREVPGMRSDAVEGVGTLYRYAGAAGVVQVATDLRTVRRDNGAALAAAVGYSTVDSVVVTRTDLPASGFDWLTTTPGSGTRFTLAEAGTYRLRRPTGVAVYRPAVTRDPGTGAARLTLTDTQSVTVDGQPLPALPPVWIPLSRPDPVALTVGDQPPRLLDAVSAITAAPGTAVTAYAPVPGPSVLAAAPSGSDDCQVRSLAGSAAGTLAASGRTPAIQPAPDKPAAHPGSLAGSPRGTVTGCARASLLPAASGVYRIRLSYRTPATGGAGARVCVSRAGSDPCAGVPDLDPSTAWRPYTAVVRVPPDAAAPYLYLYGTAGPGGERAEYRDVLVDALAPAGTGTLDDADAAEQVRQLAAGQHTVAIGHPYAVGEAAPVPLGDCPPPSRTAPVRLPDGSVELPAPPGTTTCLRTAGLPAADPGTGGSALVPRGSYQLSLEYRTISGMPARVCVWQAGPDRCANLPALQASSRWRSITATVRPEPGTRSLALYVYADGDALCTTRVAYRNVRLAPAPVSGVEVSLVDTRPAAAPAARIEAATPDRYRVGIDGASGRFVLTLAESYARGWLLRGLPSGWHATHIEADGYANGWLIDGHGSATVTLEYQPRWQAYLALGISAGAVLATLLRKALPYALPARRRGRHGRRRRTPA